jgi:hypothetical protein
MATERVETAARAHRIPLSIVDLDAEDAAKLYDHKLVLVRADQHVAWRGDALPDDVVGLVNVLRGVAV